ncbi:MAG: ROK family protein [Thermotoga sp. 50_1627]|uniref:ROK family protein n=1 Tax=Pseudothermotoga sp. TaxID=2033661 RepID=UPI00076C49E3|nr:MAG: ROK family protein [Thermotoga sp. 50_64]KUK24607.1 MAG: ROK family protein [Thermotoga sp. 50_1627]MBC7117138.1 ROK family protein [Pseudothermotoga sp.]
MSIIAIDIGGTMIKAGLVRDQELELRTLLPLNKHEPLLSLWNIIETLIHKNQKIEAIGIATAGRVDSHRGVVLYASSNIPKWSGLHLSKIVKDRYAVPCFILNDARAAALAEARQRGISDLVLLTVGTGLGGGIVLNDQLIFGNSWEAGEIGHTILKPNGRKCNCGKKGCAETYISMRVLHKYSHEKDRRRLIERFKEKDPDIISAVERMCKDLAIVIDKIFLTIDPQLVVIGGGFCELGPDALEILRDHVKMYSQRSLYDISQIDFSILGNNAGIIGAAMYAKERLLGGS